MAHLIRPEKLYKKFFDFFVTDRIKFSLLTMCTFTMTGDFFFQRVPLRNGMVFSSNEQSSHYLSGFESTRKRNVTKF